MLLVLEISLTLWAWRRGWKGYALLPLGCAFGLGLLLGMTAGVSGETDTSSLIAMGAMLDLIAIVTLVVMGAKGRNLETTTPTEAQIPESSTYEPTLSDAGIAQSK